MSRQHSSGDLIADRRYAYAEACLAEGDPAAAAEMAEQARSIDAAASVPRGTGELRPLPRR